MQFCTSISMILHDFRIYLLDYSVNMIMYYELFLLPLQLKIELSHNYMIIWIVFERESAVMHISRFFFSHPA